MRLNYQDGAECAVLTAVDSKEMTDVPIRHCHGLALILLLAFACPGRAGHLPTLEPLLDAHTRLMVFSPHPDDETLGVGGLMQRVLEAGGKVRVVVMTNGDGFSEGVKQEDHISHPTATDYRKYGDERRVETLSAVAGLGVPKQDVVFLGFPDGGLRCLLWKVHADPQAYTSPFTQENRPPADEVLVPHTDYNARDLDTELVREMSDFRPNLVAVTAPEDQHPDHAATYYFVKEALEDLEQRDPAIHPSMLTYLVHFGQWPLGQEAGTGTRLNPPAHYPGQQTNWVSFSLQPAEAVAKRQAILRYDTQMLVMGRYLLSFARANELYHLEAPAGAQELARELAPIPCCWK